MPRPNSRSGRGTGIRLRLADGLLGGIHRLVKVRSGKARSLALRDRPGNVRQQVGRTETVEDQQRGRRTAAAVRPGSPSPWAVFRPSEFLDDIVVGVLRALDPQAWETEEHFWPMRADDCHMGELLE